MIMASLNLQHHAVDYHGSVIYKLNIVLSVTEHRWDDEPDEIFNTDLLPFFLRSSQRHLSSSSECPKSRDPEELKGPETSQLLEPPCARGRTGSSWCKHNSPQTEKEENEKERKKERIEGRNIYGQIFLYSCMSLVVSSNTIKQYGLK